jgi:hypothetical protein
VRSGDGLSQGVVKSQVTVKTCREAGSSAGGTPATTRSTTPTLGSHFPSSQTPLILLTYRLPTATDLGPTPLADPGAGSIIVGATGVAQVATVAKDNILINDQDASKAAIGVSTNDLHDSPTV